MRKNIGIFILGIIAGIVIMGIVAYNGNDTQAPGNLDVQPVLLDKPGECLSCNNFKVFQALSPGYGLAVELEKGTYSNVESASGVVVLIKNAEGKMFEDGQIVKVSKSKCARKIGTYSYTLNNKDKKTVPVVQIMDKEL